MSKKSKPGDGTHGKGVRGGGKHEEFNAMFQSTTTPQQKDEQQAEQAGDESEA